MMNDQTEMTDPYSQKENFFSKGFPLKGVLRVICVGSPFTAHLWTLDCLGSLCISYSRFLFDPHIQGINHRAHEAEASFKLLALLKRYF